MIVWPAHKNWVRRIVFLGDGRTLATTAGMSRYVWIWDAGTRSQLRKLDAHQPPVRSRQVSSSKAVEALAASADGRRLATINCNYEVKVWEAETGQELYGWRLLGTYGGIALSPDGSAAVAMPWSQGAGVFNLTAPATDQGIPPLLRELQVSARRFAYSPDGKWIAGNTTTGLSVWHVSTYQHFDRPAPSVHWEPGPIAFSPDGIRVATVRGAEVHTWVRDRWAVGPVFHGNGSPVFDIAYSPDGRALLSAAQDGTIRISDTDTGETPRTFDFGVGEVRAAAFSPDGLTAAVGGEEGQIVVWDVDL